MYKREIEGRTELASESQIEGCLQCYYDHPDMNLVKGQWQSTPSAELIAAEGWEKFTPPTPEPTPQTEPSFESKVQALNKMLEGKVYALDDESALEVISLFPAWADNIGKQAEKDWRTYYDEKLYKCLQPHIIQADWAPDKTPALWVEVSVEEWPEIPEHIPSTAPWNTGDKGTWKGQHYICKMDGCVWNPDEYGVAWELVNE